MPVENDLGITTNVKKLTSKFYVKSRKCGRNCDHEEILIKNKKDCVDNDKMSRLRRKKMFYSQIFGQKKAACTAGAIMNLSIV